MDEIILVPYDPAWPDAFAREADAIRQLLRPRDVRLEHVGSTAVPGLPAKPVIDILLTEPDQTAWPAFIESLPRLGYAFWHDNPNRTRLFFVKGLPPAPRRTHHVHVVDTETAARIIAFRNRLRADASLAAAYAARKSALAEQFKEDRDAYTDAKSVFIEQALKNV